MRLLLNRQQVWTLRKTYKYSSGKEKQLAQVALLSYEGWSQSKIAKALNLDEQTVLEYLQEYLKPKPPIRKRLYNKYTLTPDQTAELVAHIEKNPYISIGKIRQYIEKHFNDLWTEPAVNLFLKQHNFSCVGEQVLHSEVITKNDEKRPIYKYFRGWFKNSSAESDNSTSHVAPTHKAG